MKKYLIFTFLLLGTIIYAQKKVENLNFEAVENNFPKIWNPIRGNSGKAYTDTHEKQEGKTSVVIENEKEGFSGIMYTLPENYDGKEITVSGFIKTQNITEGYASLWMRIDPEVSFKNMQDLNINGTNDWKKYEISLKLSPNDTKKIVVGALLSGKGKMWVDNLQITIDGENIDKVKAFDKKVDKINSDKEFDNGSKINAINLDKNNVEYLKNLGLIWGYLKYYHPNVAAGNFNWDYELFRIYHKSLGASENQRNQILIDWIKSLGEFQTKNDPEPKNLKMKADLKWITTSGFSKELTDLLLKVKTAERKNSNYYISLDSNVQNPIFRNENPYPKMTSPDAGFRLLSLYRYWNIIQYYFPYRYAIGEDWKKVLSEFIPKFINATDETKYTLVCLEIATRINDSHARVNNKITHSFFGTKFPPLEIDFIENSAVIKNYLDDELGKKTDLKIGDVILEVDGKNILKILEEKSKYLPASNRSGKLSSLSNYLLRTNNDQINVKYLSHGVTKTTSLKTYKYDEINYTQKQPSMFTMLNNNIAYLHMADVKKDKLSDIFNKIKNTKGLVIDLRTYPSKFVIFEIGNFLLSKPEQFVKFSTTTLTSPGDYIIKEGAPIGTNNKNYYLGKIAILVNETSISSSEYHTMALRKAPHAKVFGSQTAGADGNVSYITLPGELQTTFTGIGIYNPDESETQRIGIIPDIEVKPTIEGIKNSRDEVLEKAMKWINN